MPDDARDFDFASANLPTDASGFKLDDDADPTFSDQRVCDVTSFDTKTV